MNFRLLVILVLLAGLLPCFGARAAVSSVSVIPASTTATLGQNNHVLLTWRVTSNLSSPILSTQGRFTSPNGQIVLGINGTALHGNTPPSPSNISEALAIPTAVLQAAANQNLGTIVYTRTFTDDDGAPLGNSGSLTINVVVPSLIAASTAPSQFTATLQAGAQINTIWTVTSNASGLAVHSTFGAFRLSPNGPALLPVPRLLSGTTVGNSVRFPETVQVPTSVVYQVLAAHQNVFYFVRHFEPVVGGGGADAVIEIHIGGSSAGPLALARLTLRFSDGSRRRVVGTDHPLRALAEINYSGAGLLQAVWEVATPPSTSGHAMYRPLQFVRQYLLPGGHMLLQSPPLPVDMAGRYVLRLRLQTPLIDSAPLALEYNVNPALHGAREKPMRMLPLRSPGGGTSLDAATHFSWQPVPEAQAYQLELYAADVLPDAQPPQGGMVVRASTTRLQLSALARAHLQSGRSYRWRVLAIGKDGRVLAESDLRELLVP